MAYQGPPDKAMAYGLGPTPVALGHVVFLTADLSAPTSTIAAVATKHVPLLQALSLDPSGASIGFAKKQPLPAGHLVEVPEFGPLYWVSTEAPTVDDLAAARAKAGITGLWPSLIDCVDTTIIEPAPRDTHERLSHWLGEGRPSNPLAIDPEQWLAERWPALIAENEQDEDYEPEHRVSQLAPKGTSWPGLAPTVASISGADAYANLMTAFVLDNGWLEQPRMALIPATSGSDALVAARCTLADIDDLAGHAAVLGSWEQRFGARVIALRRDTLHVSVAAAPMHQAAAAQVGCEHFVFAPDNVLQNSDSFAEYVDGLINANLWSFWWD